MSPDNASYRRVGDALRHREPDRLPLDIGGTRVTGVHAAAYRGYRARLGLKETFPRMQIRYLQLPKVEEDFRSLLGVDLESADPDTAVEESAEKRDGHDRSYTDRWGCRWLMPEGGHYFDTVGFPLAHAETPADLRNTWWPDEDSSAMLDPMVHDAAEIVLRRGRALVLGRTCPGIYEMLHVLCGYEKALTDLACNPALSEAIMDRILELKLTYYREAIKRVPADAGYFIVSESDDLGGQSGLIVSPRMYRRLIKPRHALLFRAIKEYSRGRAFIELHSCGAIREIIPDLIESGVEILNPVQVSAAGMGDTKALKRDFGADVAFHGGGVDSQRTLPYGTPQEVRDEVKRRIADLAPGGGFIFTPVHSIQHDVPYENFLAMLEAYREVAGI